MAGGRARGAALALLAAAVAGSAATAVPPARYAPWAHKHWVWVASEDSTQSSVLANLDGYLSRNISVGGVNVDSAWSTGFNNYEFDKTKYPDPKGMVDAIHARGAKVILWTTSMIDSDSSNYEEAVSKGYVLKNAVGQHADLKWWHGKGSLLDYTNAEAVTWWHSQLDKALDLGIDGWKCDGTDPYMIMYLVAMSSKGPISYREYADAYYGDFLNYTREHNGDHCLIMARPVDSFNVLAPVADAYLSFAPRYAVVSGWVGDQDPTWDGMQDALRNMIHSAWRGYVNFGCDIGGYRHGAPRTAELLTRWFQLGAFLPLMENGGDGHHEPWQFDTAGSTAVSDRYRKFAAMHDELVPYLLTQGSQALDTEGATVVRPMAPPPRFDLLLQLRSVVSTYNYKLGPSFFVAPITAPMDAAATASQLLLTLPAGYTWVEWLAPHRKFPGGSSFAYECDIDHFPVFVCAGCLVPLHVTTPSTDYADLAPAASDDEHATLTLFVHTPDADVTTDVTVREWKAEGATASYRLDSRTGALTLTASSPTRAVRWLVRGLNLAPPERLAAVDASGADVPFGVPRAAGGRGWWARPQLQELSLWLAPGAGQQTVTISGAVQL